MLPNKLPYGKVSYISKNGATTALAPKTTQVGSSIEIWSMQAEITRQWTAKQSNSGCSVPTEAWQDLGKWVDCDAEPAPQLTTIRNTTEKFCLAAALWQPPLPLYEVAKVDFPRLSTKLEHAWMSHSG